MLKFHEAEQNLEVKQETTERVKILLYHQLIPAIMNLSILSLLVSLSTTSAFSISPHAVLNSVSSSCRSRTTTPSSSSRYMYFAEEQVETETDGETIYDKIGFPEEKVALGIDPNQVAEWIGNRDALISKFQEDNQEMDAERINMEVDKFMMDAELVNYYIDYQKRKASGWVEEQKKSPPPSILTIILSGYIAFVVFNSLKGIFFKGDIVDSDSISDSVQNAVDVADVVQDVADATAGL